MSTPRNLTRQRVIDAALELFAAQGVAETTTKQIAECAAVNEVTLFRHFGNKYGLLLAVIEESAVFSHLGQTLMQRVNQSNRLEPALKDYASACLDALDRSHHFWRSLVGESGHHPPEIRQALGRGFTQTNHYVAQYFQTVINQGQFHPHLPAETLASLLNQMLLGYAVIQLTSECHEPWQDREQFLNHLVILFLQGAVARPSSEVRSHSVVRIADLPASLVHQLLQLAKKRSLSEYALVYVLFGAGLTPTEIAGLARAHHISDRSQHLLQVTTGLVRRVPVNQWIMGKRYGSYLKNPLTQWLKTRRDSQSALFLNAYQQPITVADIQAQWQELVAELELREAIAPTIKQAQQTWCVEMLTRGLSLEAMQILTGWTAQQLEPYAQRAKEKAALEQAIRLDHKL
jgi:AcrR family transcriptional regulator